MPKSIGLLITAAARPGWHILAGIIIGFLICPSFNYYSLFINLKYSIMKKNLFAVLAVSGLLFFSSCGPGEIVVTTRPAAPVYVRPSSPGIQYVWIEGNWVGRRGHYQWREGHWARVSKRVWIEGSWESRPNGWYWRKGHWR